MGGHTGRHTFHRERGLPQLQRQASALLESLALPSPFTLVDLHAKVEQRRDRPLHLVGKVMPIACPHGLWIAGTSADYVFYDAGTSAVHQVAILAHEFGHILNDDSASTIELRAVLDILLPDVDPEMVAFLVARTTYEHRHEQRAELFATLVSLNIDRWSTTQLPPPADPKVLARMTATLEACPRG